MIHAAPKIVSSAADRWNAGGILQSMPWTGEPASIISWMSEVLEVRPGDSMVVLRKPAGVLIIGVQAA